MPTYYCSVHFHVRGHETGGVQPHVPGVYTRPTRYAVLTGYRGMHSLRMIVPVEPFDGGRWRVETRDGWVIFDEGQTWGNPEAALDEEFRRLEADKVARASPDSR